MRVVLPSPLIMTLIATSSFLRVARSFRVVAAASGPRRNPFFGATAPTTTTTARSMSSGPPPPGGEVGPMPKPDQEMPFYALGTNLALQVGGQGNLKTLLDDKELDIVLEAFCDNLRGTNTQDARVVLGTYGQQLNQILQERQEKIVDRVRKDGDDFIRNFLDCTPEAVLTDNGMVYYEMTPGQGASPSIDSTVEVHYHGTLTDGTVFDSSVERGQTISFPLNGVIKGWQEGLQMMKEGGKATLVIPSELAYGETGSGDTIPPGATLKFEVELFKVS